MSLKTCLRESQNLVGFPANGCSWTRKISGFHAMVVTQNMQSAAVIFAPLKCLN